MAYGDQGHLYRYFWAFAMGMFPKSILLSSLAPSDIEQHFVPVAIWAVALYWGRITAARLYGHAGELHNTPSRAQAVPRAYKIVPYNFSIKIITYVNVVDLHWMCWNRTTYSYVVLQVMVKLMSALRAFLVCANKFLSWKHYLPDFPDKLHIRVDLF